MAKRFSAAAEGWGAALHAMLGVGLLLPWNSFITAVDYFGALYPNSHIDRLFGVCYTWATLCTLTANVAMGLEKHPAGWRIGIGYAMFLVAVIMVPVIGTVAHPGTATTGTLVATLGCVVLTGLGDGLAQGSLFGSVASFNPRHSQAVIWGMSLSGLVVSILRIATKASSPGADAGALERSARLYFAISATWVFLCLLARPCASRVFRLYDRLERTDGLELPALTTRPSSGSVDGAAADRGEARLLRPDEPLSSSSSASASPVPLPLATKHGAADETTTNPVADAHVPPPPPPPPRWVDTDPPAPRRAVIKFVSHRAFLVGLCYAVTLAIFPGFLAENVSSPTLGDWYPVLLITAFNAGDVVGKALPALPSLLPQRTRTYVMLAWGRLVFFPLFYAAGRASSASTPAWAVALTFVLTLLLGVTSGQLGASLMMTYPEAVRAGLRVNGWSSGESSALEVAGMVMALSLVLGLAVGTALAYLWLL